VILIILGLVILVANFGVFGITWDVIWRLWPTILIYAGLVRIVRYFNI